MMSSKLVKTKKQKTKQKKTNRKIPKNEEKTGLKFTSTP